MFLLHPLTLAVATILWPSLDAIWHCGVNTFTEKFTESLVRDMCGSWTAEQINAACQQHDTCYRCERQPECDNHFVGKMATARLRAGVTQCFATIDAMVTIVQTTTIAKCALPAAVVGAAGDTGRWIEGAAKTVGDAVGVGIHKAIDAASVAGGAVFDAAVASGKAIEDAWNWLTGG